jgi:hypothetical protein
LRSHRGDTPHPEACARRRRIRAGDGRGVPPIAVSSFLFSFSGPGSEGTDARVHLQLRLRRRLRASACPRRRREPASNPLPLSLPSPSPSCRGDRCNSTLSLRSWTSTRPPWSSSLLLTRSWKHCPQVVRTCAINCVVRLTSGSGSVTATATGGLGEVAASALSRADFGCGSRTEKGTSVMRAASC